MLKHLLKTCFVLLIFFNSNFVFSQESNKIKLDDLMTPEEKSTLGLNKLSLFEKFELEKWLNDLILRVYITANEDKFEYIGTGDFHWILSKTDDGEIIILEDDSIWLIESIDRINSILWLNIDTIKVIEDNDAIGDYKYILINTDNSEIVHAKFLTY